MKKILSSLAAALLLPMAAVAQVSFGQAELINNDWEFSLDDGPWQNIDLPHDWSVCGTLSPSLASGTGYLPGGVGHYRKSLTIPETGAGEKVYLYFEGVYNRSEVYLNGHLLGSRPNGYISFMYDATPHVRFGGENELTVKVDHSRSADSRWYTGSGIYRDVWMVLANPVHIAQWGVYAWPETATDKQGVLRIETEIENGSDTAARLTVVGELFDPAGGRVGRATSTVSVEPGASATVPTRIKVSKPALWSVDNPRLYTLVTSVLRDGREIDRTETRTGFRTLEFDPDKGFALNGEWMKVKGVCLHHDAGALGAAVPKEVWRRRLTTLKEVGCNAVRTSHNPQAPALYDLCDELGLLVMDEAFDEWEHPKRKWIEGWNVGTPGFHGSFDFFEQWGEVDLADMVRRDRNHISIFAWSIGNEVDYPNDPYSHPALDGDGHFTQASFGGYKPDSPNAERLGEVAKRLAAVVKLHDRSRPVTAGLAGVVMSNHTEYPGALDIAGYNYTENRYTIDHQLYPDRVIYGSENRHDKEAWDAVTGNEHIFGQFLWTGIDYLGESGRWPSRGFYSGLLDFGGYIKPRGYYRQSLWSEEPMAYLGTYPAPRDPRQNAGLSMDAWPVWNYADGERVRVVCYTNAKRARLLLNDREVGEEKPYDQLTGIIYWDIPYADGVLEVVGRDAAGEETVRHSIRTSGRSHEIRAVSVEGRDGFWQILLQIVDEHGVPVMLADDQITCSMQGPARLMALEASNNSDMGDYTDNTQRAFMGKLLAYVQAGGKTKVTFSAPWLKAAEITIGEE